MRLVLKSCTVIALASAKWDFICVFLLLVSFSIVKYKVPINIWYADHTTISMYKIWVSHWCNGCSICSSSYLVLVSNSLPNKQGVNFHMHLREMQLTALFQQQQQNTSKYEFTCSIKKRIVCVILLSYILNHQILDYLLGKGHKALYRRAELRTLVDMHGNKVFTNDSLLKDSCSSLF